MEKERRMRALLLAVAGMLLLAGCSTTKNLPEGEILYTGISQIEVTDADGSRAGEAALDEVESALAYAPNNALFGSSTTRVPLPVGLWIYNAYVNAKGGVGRWIFNTFGSKPVLVNTVNPDVRVAVARNLLRENGYFDGTASYEIIPDKKDERKAKIGYQVTMNHAYTLDSIRYMRMRHYADTLINATMADRLLRTGDNFNVVQLEAERQRIATLLRNNGFYYFRPDYIVYQADTLMSAGKVWLRIQRKDGVPQNALRPYKVGNIAVYLNGYNNEAPTDSVLYKDMTIHYQGKLRIRPSVLYNRFTFKPGDIYEQREQQRTQTGISRLGVFRFAEFQYIPQADTTARRGRVRDRESNRNDVLDLRVNTVYDLPLDGELEVNVTTKSNDYAGPGLIFGLTKRNAFRGGEVLGVQARGSYEWQTGNRVEGDGSKVNSYELGLSSTLTFPFLLFPGFYYRDLEQPSSTTFRIYYDLLNRARFFKMSSFGGNVTYDFRPTPTTRHSVTPFRLSYNKLNSTAFFDSIADVNKGLYMSLRDQLIPAISYTFTYDNHPIQDRHHFWWETSVTEAGNLVGAVYSATGKDFNKADKKLFGNPFAQFIKATSEVRYNHRLDKNNRLVGRIGVGAIYSYGNARVSPYNEQFYIGGANSVRAFTIRSVGPGRYFIDADSNPYAYIDRTGDIKFEANLEYRFRMAGDLYGALFLDSGGIWLIRDDKDRPNSQLKWGSFFKDLATGTGFGVRYDLSFLVVRVDVGIGLHLPYDTGKKGYYNIPRFKDGLGWHLAIGYPF